MERCTTQELINQVDRILASSQICNSTESEFELVKISQEGFRSSAFGLSVFRFFRPLLINGESPCITNMRHKLTLTRILCSEGYRNDLKSLSFFVA